MGRGSGSAKAGVFLSKVLWNALGRACGEVSSIHAEMNWDTNVKPMYVSFRKGWMSVGCMADVSKWFSALLPAKSHLEKSDFIYVTDIFLMFIYYHFS